MQKDGLSNNRAAKSVLMKLTRLTTMDPDHLETALQEIIAEYGSEWRSFFAYFNKTWMERFSPSMWNIYKATMELGEEIQCRTNNTLERFNRFSLTDDPLQSLTLCISAEN